MLQRDGFVSNEVSGLTMKKSHFESSISLPENLEPLYSLAMNLYWVWNGKIRRVFEKIDPQAWSGLDHNPIALLGHLSQSQINDLSKQQDFLDIVHEARRAQLEYIDERSETWFRKKYGILSRN